MSDWVAPTVGQLRDLEVLVNAHHPLWVVETVEEDRVRTILAHLADRVGLPLFVWHPVTGLARVDAPPGPGASGTDTAKGCLAFIEQANMEALFFLPSFPLDAEDAAQGARMKEIYRRYFKHRGALVLTTPQLDLPKGLDPLFTHVELHTPTAETYHRFITQVIRDISARRAVKVDMTPEDVSELLGALHGLTFFEVQKIITQAVVEDGMLTREDLGRVMDAKRRIVERSGVLEYFPHDHNLSEVAGLGNLKRWLRKRRAAFTEPARAKEFGLTAPRGLLLLGVQGCGKSLCAKAVASEWGLPLLRLDPSNLYTKYFGESERNLKRAIQTAESMAPVVLWLDEIEKALGQGDQDGGTSQRVFGTFLAWMQEKKESVFVIATANDISKLPPELLRKGRFDEIFFVDLPDAATRAEILAVHLKKRGRDPGRFDLVALGEQAEGFSGAELEQVVVSGLFTAFAEGVDVSDAVLEAEIDGTRPLSVTMEEKITALREWARERAVRADD
jgi:AAA+ superfamily predicted ATPase